MSNNNNSSQGVGFMSILFIVFLVLKLCKVITWSWWWITSPLWGGLALVLIIGVISVILARRLIRKTSKKMEIFRKKLREMDKK